MKKTGKFTMILYSFCVSLAVSRGVSAELAKPQYKETVLGKISSQKSYMATEFLISDTYDEKTDGTGFLLCQNMYKNGGSDYKDEIVYYEVQGKKKKEHKYDRNVRTYLSNPRNCIARKGKKSYLCKINQKKKEVSAVIRVFEDGSRRQKKKISLDSLLTEDVKKESFYFKSNRLYPLGKNKVRLLYSVDKPGLPRNRTYYGGYADLNIKTGKAEQKVTVDFSPEVLEYGYLCGTLCHTEKYTYQPYVDAEYKVASASTGKNVCSFPMNYGVEKEHFFVPEEGNTEMEFQQYQGLPKGENSGTFLYSHDWQGGKLLFANISGIYYASAKTGKVTKLMDYGDMPYYRGSENKRYLHAIALKSKSEVYALYTTSVDREASEEYLVLYRD